MSESAPEPIILTGEEYTVFRSILDATTPQKVPAGTIVEIAINDGAPQRIRA